MTCFVHQHCPLQQCQPTCTFGHYVMTDNARLWPVVCRSCRSHTAHLRTACADPLVVISVARALSPRPSSSMVRVLHPAGSWIPALSCRRLLLQQTSSAPLTLMGSGRTRTQHRQRRVVLALAPHDWGTWPTVQTSSSAAARENHRWRCRCCDAFHMATALMMGLWMARLGERVLLATSVCGQTKQRCFTSLPHV